MKIKLASILESTVNGIGMRRVYFSQGCNHNCKGCFNKHTHSFTGGYEWDINSLMEDLIESPYIKGVTFSGGDPLQQSIPFTYFAKLIKTTFPEMSIWCYTGYTYEHLLNNGTKEQKELLKYIDVLVDGKFEINKKKDGLKFRGSSNQRIIDVKQSIKNNKVITLDL